MIKVSDKMQKGSYIMAELNTKEMKPQTLLLAYDKYLTQNKKIEFIKFRYVIIPKPSVLQICLKILNVTKKCNE